HRARASLRERPRACRSSQAVARVWASSIVVLLLLSMSRAGAVPLARRLRAERDRDAPFCRSARRTRSPVGKVCRLAGLRLELREQPIAQPRSDREPDLRVRAHAGRERLRHLQRELAAPAALGVLALEQRLP